MSLTKRWLEKVSEQLGFEGEINDKVIEEAQTIQATMIDNLKDQTREDMYEQGLLNPDDIV